MVQEYRVRREVLHSALVDAGFRCEKPQGAYYILADFSGLSEEPDHIFSRQMARDARVLPVPGSSFFSPPELGRSLVGSRSANGWKPWRRPASGSVTFSTARDDCE